MSKLREAYLEGYREGYEGGRHDAVRHAHWEVNECGEVECNKCGFCIGNADNMNDYVPKFCPDCGARMDRKENEE